MERIYRFISFFVAIYALFLRGECVADADYAIVFVHIGKILPSHCETAIRQAALFNQKGKIILVANQSALETLSDDISLNFFSIACESLGLTEEHLLFARKSTLDHEFRDGFWNKASERFLYLHDLMATYEPLAKLVGAVF